VKEPRSQPPEPEAQFEGSTSPGLKPGSQRQARHEPPVLVIESSGPSKPRAGTKKADDETTRHLEAMVKDLLEKLRETESHLRDKDETIQRLREQTVEFARRAHAPGVEGLEADPAVQLQKLDLFGPASSPVAEGSSCGTGHEPAAPVDPGKLARAAREAKSVRAHTQSLPAVPAAPAPARPGAERACPSCGMKLRKAKCANVLAYVCLSCSGVFLEARSVRQLARTQSWFRFVARFLNAPAKAAKGGSPAKAGAR